MQSLYKKFFSDSRVILVMAVLLVLLFIFLQPRIKAVVFEKESDEQLAHFISTTVATNNFDFFKYWQVRDLSGKYFNYNSTTVEPYSILQFKALTPPQTKLVAYQGKNVESNEYLVSPSSVSDLTPLPGEQLFADSQHWIFFDKSTRHVYIRTILPLEEMFRVNGMFHTDDPHQVLTDQLWLVDTMFTVSNTFTY